MAGGINIQASDGKYVNVGFEAGASTNVSVTIPKEGGKVVVADSLQAQLDGKQNTLISGTSIKTINSTSLLGSGNIAITETAWTANDSRAKTALNASGSAPIYACRAWVNFNGTGTVAVRGSGNVSSISDINTGQYGVNLATAMPNLNYAPVCMKGYNGNFHGIHFLNQTGQMTTTYFSLATWIFNSGGYEDDPQICIAVFG